MFEVPAAKVCSIGFQTWIQLRSTRLMRARAAAPQQTAEPGGEDDAGNPAADHNDVWNRTSVRFDPRFCSSKLHATTLVDYLSAISHLVSSMGLQWLARCCEPSSPGRRA